MRTPDEQLVDASLDMGKALLLAGGEVPGAHLEYGRSVIIK